MTITLRIEFMVYNDYKTMESYTQSWIFSFLIAWVSLMLILERSQAWML